MFASSRLSRPLALWSCLFAVLALVASVAAQNSTSLTSPPASSTSGASVSLSVTQTTASATISTTIRNGTALVPTQTVVPVVLNITVTTTPTPTTSLNATSSSGTPSATATPDPYRLETKLDPAFGVLGMLLILTGIPSAFLGHKNRWTSFFLIGFYTLSLVCFVLILKYGVLDAINPPNKTLRGLFVLACTVAGVAGGGISIFFWKATRYCIGAWGGFAFALFIQCFRNGGLIHQISYRWIMYIGCIVVGFTLCTIPKIHYHIILVSTAFVGATSLMLGVDCYAVTNLKEFYIWNLGFYNIFPKYVNHGIEFPVSQTMQIELGLLGAIAVMGIAVQLRVLKILQRKLREIKEEQRKRDQAAEERAAERFAGVDEEKAEWEREHPTLSKHTPQDSSSESPLMMKDIEAGVSSEGDENRASTNTLVTPTMRQRYQSGVSTLMGSPPVDERQSPGVLPAMDLGVDLEHDVPQNYIAESSESSDKDGAKDGRAGTPSITLDVAHELEDIKKKHELLAEIQNIRKSIAMLKSETPAPSSSSESRHPSFSSRRTLSHDLGTIAGPSHPRPARTIDPRARVQSMDITRLTRSDLGNTIGRPTSVPLQQDEEWEAYLRDRKLLQPPSGVTAPIATTPVSPAPRVAVSPAITEALVQRQRRESSLSFNGLGVTIPEEAVVAGTIPEAVVAPVPLVAPAPVVATSSRNLVPPRHAPEDIPIALRPQHRKTHSQDSYAPGVILPPRNRDSSVTFNQDTQRVMSFEELAERHKEKMRQLQQPVTQNTQEQAEVAAARARWERARDNERKAVEKRQTEQAQARADKEAKQRKERRSGDKRPSVSLTPDDARGAHGHAHTRSLSADVLASVAGRQSGSSKRQSALKVQEWQRQQQEDEEEEALEHPERQPSTSRRHSGVPFPGGSSRGRKSRESRRPATMMDPPS